MALESHFSVVAAMGKILSDISAWVTRRVAEVIDVGRGEAGRL